MSASDAYGAAGAAPSPLRGPATGGGGGASSASPLRAPATIGGATHPFAAAAAAAAAGANGAGASAGGVSRMSSGGGASSGGGGVSGGGGQQALAAMAAAVATLTAAIPAAKEAYTRLKERQESITSRKAAAKKSLDAANASNDFESMPALVAELQTVAKDEGEVQRQLSAATASFASAADIGDDVRAFTSGGSAGGGGGGAAGRGRGGATGRKSGESNGAGAAIAKEVDEFASGLDKPSGKQPWLATAGKSKFLMSLLLRAKGGDGEWSEAALSAIAKGHGIKSLAPLAETPATAGKTKLDAATVATDASGGEHNLLAKTDGGYKVDAAWLETVKGEGRIYWLEAFLTAKGIGGGAAVGSKRAAEGSPAGGAAKRNAT